MIENITLRNFQCHEKLTVGLSPTVTTLVGDSDAGKSSVVRSLYWLSFNRPQGYSFVGRFGQAASVTVTVRCDDGHIVGRRRSRTKNLYRLGNRLYSAVGTSVPQPVGDLLNVGEVNFQGQLDSPFWFALPPGEVSRQLNGIVNLGLIDKALSNAATGLRQARAKVQVSQERLLNARTRQEGLKWAVDLDQDVSAVEALGGRLAAARQNADSLRLAASDCLARGRTYRKASDAADAGLRILATGKKYLSTKEQRYRLSALTVGIERYTKQLQEPGPDLSDVDRTWKAYDDTRRRQRFLNSILLGIAQLEHEVQFADVQIGGLREHLRKLSGGKCPTCGRPLNR